MNKEKKMEIFDLVVKNKLLPANIEDLVPLSFIGTEAVKYYKSKIMLMDKLGITEEQKKETLKDGQNAGIMLLDIEARIGELIDGYDNKQIHEKGFYGTKPAYPKEIAGTENAGKRHRSRAIKNNPNIVKEIIKEAIQNEDIPTKTAVLNKIKLKKYMEKHPSKKEDMPDINYIALGIYNKLTECYVKLLEIYKHKNNLSRNNLDGLTEVIDKLYSLKEKQYELEQENIGSLC